MRTSPAFKFIDMVFTCIIHINVKTAATFVGILTFKKMINCYYFYNHLCLFLGRGF